MPSAQIAEPIPPGPDPVAPDPGDAYLGQTAIRAAFLEGLAPDPDLTVTEWADEHRYLTTRGSAEAGKYRSARTPYLREIMNELGPKSRAQKVVFMKSAQIGATEAGHNWIGFVIDVTPGPMMCVQPTIDLAKMNSVQKLEPLIEESPRLRAKVQKARGRDSGNTQMGKKFKGGFLRLTGANSATGLRSFAARYTFLDEVDAYVGDIDGEGDPVMLVWNRMNTFGARKKMFLPSTPTIKGLSRVEREFELSDQRRYHVPCPHCGTLQWLKFEKLRWEKGRPKTVHYQCEGCEEPILEYSKTWMMDPANGAAWISTAPEDVRLKAEEEDIVGFHLSALYSPIGWLSWAEIARQWEAAQGSDGLLKTFKNTVLAETWQERGEAPDWQRLWERRNQKIEMGVVPLGGLFVTAGADVQPDRIEVDAWAWGRENRSWLIEHEVFYGDTSQDAVWDQLTAFLSRTWASQAGPRLSLARLAVDSGDGNSTNRVYRWVRKMGPGQVIAIKGADGFNRTEPVSGPTFVEVTEGGRKIRRGVRLWTITVGVFKTETYRWLRQVRRGDEEEADGAPIPVGYMDFPAQATAEWFKQLTAEQLMTVRTKRGYQKQEWQQMRDRNEALDCRVYARAAAWLMGVDRWDDHRWREFEAQIDDAKADGPPAGQTRPPEKKTTKPGQGRSPGFLGGRKKGFLG